MLAPRTDESPRIRWRRRLLYAALATSIALFCVDRIPAWYYDPRPANPPGHLLVYTTSWCPVCKRLKSCLQKANVPFEERDIETSRRWEMEWSVVGIGSIPVTLVGKEVAYGLRRGELEPLLAQAGYKPDCWSAEALRSFAAETAPKRGLPQAP